MNCRFAVVLPGLTLLSACPQTLPDLEQPSGNSPEVVSFVPNAGFAANKAKDFEGTEVEITTAHLAASGDVSVYFGDVAATAVDRDGDKLRARVPAKARTGAIEVEQDGVRASSRDNFMVLGAPELDTVKPGIAFAPRGLDDACPDEVEIPDESRIRMPSPTSCKGLDDSCSGEGSCLVISGKNLGIGPGYETTTATLKSTISDTEVHLPATVLAAYYDRIVLCVPEGTWNVEHRSWNIEVETPAADEIGIMERVDDAGGVVQEASGGKAGIEVIIAGCPIVTSVAPQAAYENGVVTIFGNGFTENTEEINVVLFNSTDISCQTAMVLDTSQQSITIQVPSGIAQEVVEQVDLVVATPAGLGKLSRPFLVMGPPEIFHISPPEVFADNPSRQVDRPWQILIEGSGFDISSTAANVVEFEDELHNLVRGNVENVTPVSLAVRVPAGLEPGWARVIVSTTAGASAHEASCGPYPPGPGAAVPAYCVRILGPARVEGFWPRRAAWGDAVGVLGGPFDPQNFRQISVTWSHVGGTETGTADVLDATIDRLLIWPNVSTGMNLDASGTVRHLAVRVETSAGASETDNHLQIVDNRVRLTDTVFERPENVLWRLPTETARHAVAAREPYFFGILANRVVYRDPIRDIERDFVVNNAQALATTPYGSRLFVAGMDSASNQHIETFALNRNGDYGQENLGNPETLQQREVIVALAAGRSHEELGSNTLAVVTESSPSNDAVSRTAHVFRGPLDAFASDSQWCRLERYFFEQVFVVEDFDGSERVLAVVDLNKGATTYYAGLNRDGGAGNIDLQPLDWACASREELCLALVELTFAAHDSSDAGYAGSPEPTVVPLIHGLPLHEGSRIIPALIGHTALVTSSTPLGDAHDEWGRLVDYSAPVRCEQVMTPCERTFGEQQQRRFVAPAFVFG
ncbi:MAG: hypothetical protein JXR83_10225, partial [Deltaproteobacteria bacterium]|nr:hypothetical protein [Deltaproteobacteria bacterium]